VWWSRLDIDELAASGEAALPAPDRIGRPVFAPCTPSGTVVRLVRCDRLEYKTAPALVARLRKDLGRIYRHYLAGRIGIRVNGELVAPDDPLCLQAGARLTGGTRFGDDLIYRIPAGAGEAVITARFSELPIDRWHQLPATDKRAMGVTAGPPVSVVRAGREIDRGWFFMGGKRRENYDDWWRLEISFGPAADELFGITHAKQAITPRPELTQVLAPDLEPIARALSARARNRFQLLKASEPLTAAEQQAARAASSLPRLPRPGLSAGDDLRDRVDELARSGAPYRIAAAELSSTRAYEVATTREQTIVLLNTKHPLYRDLYGPLALSESVKDHDTARLLALTVLAAARAEAAVERPAGRATAAAFRRTWGDVLATFFNA
jgi:hypothetical protein